MNCKFSSQIEIVIRKLPKFSILGHSIIIPNSSGDEGINQTNDSFERFVTKSWDTYQSNTNR